MYEYLQIYWWIVVSLIGGLFVFMMFVQGGQTLVKKIAKDEAQKDLFLNSVGKKWELTFTTLVMFGGACFAAFPLFYATSFGGAYWVWLGILFCFIIQAVAYEYRKKPNNFLGQKTYENFLYINGSLGVILIGIAVSTFFSGSSFALDSNNFVDWQSKFRGLEALKNPFNYILGIALFFQARVGGAMYLINNINDDKIRENLKKNLKFDALIFVTFLVAFLLFLVLKSGYGVTENGVVEIVRFKYGLNYLEMPIVLIMLLIGLILALFGLYKAIFTTSIKGIFPYGLGVVLVVMSVFLVAGLNSTAFYPSHFDLQSSLTIKNASSSFYTLKVMAIVSLWAPVLLGYIAYVWRLMDAKKLTKDEIE
ncbi:cytochrome d ubiquinol oxidase subunit II [Campylobacter ureolyticus]|uniref:cytochrome d ubiquinol oxidase subunit II n=1 Tax=Campylobacter ureolyticus TaxID=827 RepID=UPI0022B3645E|nr:cytochrome d ubiquinol oxidase subunit II [Campylobacter ureolyticus]MCZ6133763.1 cytochrome d ubiquinol oxidase subunit II [Campylobacter ureolyticus]MCZ6169673.1 cytochrome d ubiquinol oxidase subunit II [Campylobacter ureolyticus]MDU7070519.1 cytochrome d ubiquinol oxidase subunit II [Campylobacter ureolyticus]